MVINYAGAIFEVCKKWKIPYDLDLIFIHELGWLCRFSKFYIIGENPLFSNISNMKNEGNSQFSNISNKNWENYNNQGISLLNQNPQAFPPNPQIKIINVRLQTLQYATFIYYLSVIFAPWWDCWLGIYYLTVLKCCCFSPQLFTGLFTRTWRRSRCLQTHIHSPRFCSRSRPVQ